MPPRIPAKLDTIPEVQPQLADEDVLNPSPQKAKAEQEKKREAKKEQEKADQKEKEKADQEEKEKADQEEKVGLTANDLECNYGDEDTTLGLDGGGWVGGMGGWERVW